MQFAPPPLELIERKDGRLSRVGQQWFLSLTQALQQATTTLKSVSLTAQSASLTTTTVPLGTFAAGLYRVTYYARVTTAAGVASSLDVTVGWTDGAVPCSVTSAAMTGNTTSTVQSGSVLVHVDANGPITYATTYASNPASAMVYRLDLAVEAV